MTEMSSGGSPLRRLLLLLLLLQQASAARVCPPCGDHPVPYPFSTSSSCGHPLYPLACTAQRTLHFRALSGNYTVKAIDPAARAFTIATADFVAGTCITTDSLSPGNFSLDRSLPISISPTNTIFLFNASSSLKFSPLQCSPSDPCNQALTVLSLQSCRSLLCCSFSTGASLVFKYSFPASGLETGYASAVNLVNGSDPATWRFGLQLAWDLPSEPPCSSANTACGQNSTCSSRANGPGEVCLCNGGHFWDPYTGTCPSCPNQRYDYCKKLLSIPVLALTPSPVFAAPNCVRRSNSFKCRKTEYAAGLSLGLLGLIALSILTAVVYRSRKSARRAHVKLVKERSMFLAANSGGKSARLFSKREMKRATKDFARDRVLGCGGFGEVYKGILDDGSVVAIKSAKIGNVKGIDQVLNEVRVLSQVNHRSLVRLLGCCVESELPLMVYEYVPNGSLYDRLKDSLLDWRTRLAIGFQSAEGLAYLHSAAYPPIYHRDVKSSNILLDKTMNARVADFGLSRLAEPDLTHVSTCAQGTLGYLDPEYYRNYQLTDKSDVYSFGVVLLELATSQRAIDFGRSQDEVNLAVMVEQKREEGRLDEVLDEELVKGASAAAMLSMMEVIKLALQCLQENRLDRPCMKEVAERLQGIMSTLDTAERSRKQE